MAILRNVTFLAVASWMAAAGPFGPENASAAGAASCKRKTAGFYLADMNTGAARPLAVALQGLSGSLTGVPGDAERGREVLVSRQKGDCLSCHKVSTLGGAAAQGAIGPVLDGVGNKYSDAQFRQVLIDPKALFPDTIMPSYYTTSSASVLTAADTEDLIAFLQTLK